MKGRKQPISQRQKLCAVRSQNPTWKKNFSGAKILFKEVWFRSATEAELAKGLEAQRLHWKYEELQLSYFDRDGIQRFYTPDFWIQEWGKFIEVKRDHIDKEDREKLRLVARDNPDVRLEVWTRKDVASWLTDNEIHRDDGSGSGNSPPLQ